MGLPSDLNNVSSDSIPILLVALAAHCVCYLKSLLYYLLQSVGLSRSAASGGDVPDGLFNAVGSGLASLIALTGQLKVSRVYTFSVESENCNENCVVCMYELRDGDQVRKLACRHVFHRACVDGWLDRRNLSCPLCRAPLVEDERVVETERHVGEQLVTWFSATGR